MVSFSRVFKKTKNNKDVKIKGSATKEFLSKLSGSFFIVISLMPFAGLLLGIGAAILSQIPNPTGGGQVFGYAVGEALNQIGSALFSNLGLFFAIAIVMGFTKNWQSGLTSLWAYFVFNGFQSAMISTFAHNIDMSNPSSTFVFWFYHTVPVSVLNTNVGFLSMNSSVIGGLFVGGIVVWCWKKYSETELFSFLSFFNGSRFVPFVVTVAVIPLAFIYLLLWPIVGIGLVALGNEIGNLNGWQFFIVALIWRWLTPFGVHHAFYSVFWFTSIGGSLSPNDLIYVGGKYLGNNHWASPSSIYKASMLVGPNSDYVSLSNWLIAHGENAYNIVYPQGDNGVWFFMEKNGIPFDSFIFAPDPSNPTHLGERLVSNTGLFLAPNFPVFIGGSVGSISAMIYCSPKKDRKKVAAIMGSALITSCAIGVTEPWLWSYILISPFLFFGFHSIMTALGAYIMAVLPTKSEVGPISGTHLPVTSSVTVNSHPGVTSEVFQSHQHVATAFSTGILDYIIYGLIPIKNGTNPYWVFPLAFLYVFIYYIMFVSWIKFRKLQIPIMSDAGDVVEVSKDAARSQRNSDVVTNNLLLGLGGGSNIVNIFNCATRVRVDIKNASMVDTNIIAKSGAVKTIMLGNNVQIIYGVKAQTIAQKANNFLIENKTFGDDFWKKRIQDSSQNISASNNTDSNNIIKTKTNKNISSSSKKIISKTSSNKKVNKK